MIIAYIDPGSGYVVSSFGAWIVAFLVGFFGVFLFFIRGILGFLKRHWKIVLIVILIVLTIGAITAVILMNKDVSKFDGKVIILGFDGLSPEIIEPMMKEARLPNFSRLKAEGSYSHLSTTNPSQSPVAWTGFSTGQNPGKNGVYDFIVRDPKTYGLRLSLTNIVNGKAKQVIQSKRFWQYTSDKKVPNVIIACPVTFPPDKICGKMLSGMGVPDILGTEGTFTFYTSEILGKDKDVGGKAFHVNKSRQMSLDLIGPKVATAKGKAANTKVPLKVTLKNSNSASVKYQNNEFELKTGQWSDWKEVTFKLSLFKKAKGVFKFYLEQIDPEFRLYISPINFDPRDPFFQISYPKNYSENLTDEIGLYYTQGTPMDTWAVNENRLSEKAFLEQVNEVLRERKAMLKLEFGRFEKGVLYCYFESPDIIQHMFWRYIDPQHPLYEANAPQEYKDTIENWYRKMDDILGSIMQKTSDADTLIVLSDHGFDTFRRAVNLNSWLRENGYLELKDPSAESGGELLKDIDWEKTKAYAIGFGSIYINQQGRERNGIVKPGRETELLKEEISKELKQLRDEKYNAPAVNEVYSREDIFWGKHADKTPDLYVGFNIGYRASWQTALGGTPKGIIEDHLKKWSGSHLFDPNLIPGILFTNKRIEKRDPSIYDIAPTILKIVGYSKEQIEECDFDGSPLF